MSIQVTSRAAVAPQAAVASAAPAAPAASAAPAVVKAEAAPAPKIERVQLHQPQRVDLGFRAEEMRKNLQEAVTRLNEQMQSKGRDLSFSMDERIDRTIITVKNLQTGEVVRQIPTEEVVRMAHSIEDMKGVLFNQTL
jgi:flagellar protein FlaG